MMLCAALLYVIYLFVLEKEIMHHFKRVYLLGSLVFSIVVPLLTIDIFVPKISENLQFLYASFVEPENMDIQTSSSQIITQPAINYYLIILLAYITVTAFFVLRFLKNILKIFLYGKNNFSIKYYDAKIILISEKLVPHSFLKYIFVNKDDYENNRIAEEIIIHEFAHVKQKHSLDIIFAEMLISFFWFNPVFYLFRNKIKQNHEFLADLAVIKSNKNIKHYQTILLNTINQKSNILLTSNFNYLITKKRLIMMTKTTSKTRALCKQFAIVPVLIAAICIFSSKTIAQNVTSILPQQTGGNVDETSLQEIETVETNDEFILASANVNSKPLVTENDDFQNSDTVKNTKRITASVKEKDAIPFAMVEKKPKFQDGDLNLFRTWFNKQITYPTDAAKDSIQGKVILQFTVDEKGNVKDVIVLKSVSVSLDAECLRVMNLSPKWTPGKQKDGKPVDVTLQFPVVFQLQ